MTSEKEPFCCKTAVQGSTRSSTRFKTSVKTKITKRPFEKLTAHFSPRVSVTYEVYNFRQAKQKDGEILGCFHTRLRSLAKTCDFANPDKEIKGQIILNCK